MLGLNRIHQIDALEGLKQLANGSVDLIVTDPPYNIASPSRTTMKGGKPVSTKKVWGAWDCRDSFEYDLLILGVIHEAHRVLKPGGSLYMFTAREDNGYFIRQARTRGFMYRNQLVMVKTNPIPSLSKSNWRSGFEVCMYLTKGKPKTFNFVSQTACKNVFMFSNMHKQTKHPTEKPLAFIKLAIEVSSNPGELVLDPFMGSGTTAVAAKALGRSYLGFDLEPEYIKMANERLGQKVKSNSQRSKSRDLAAR